MGLSSVTNFLYSFKGSFKEKIAKTTKESLNANINIKSSLDIDIHGSCVSRDIFNFDKNNEIKLGQYFARQSFISSVSNPFPMKINVNLKSLFEKRIVESDLKKDMFKQLANNKSNYLLIDFMDDRFSLVKYNKSFFTLSDELKNSKFFDGLDVDYIDRTNILKHIWENSMHEYVKYILEIYEPENIIIHEAYLVNSYISEYGEIKSFSNDYIYYNKQVNKTFNEYYSYLKRKLPNAHVISISNKYHAYENHIWGLSPMHYENKYYQNALNIIKNIITNSIDQE